MMLTVNAYTGGLNVPSARYRIRQHIPFLLEKDVVVREFSSRVGMYPPESKILRPAWAIANIIEHAFQIATRPTSDVVFLQREMLSTIHTWETAFKEPKVFDVDDAIFLYRNGGFTKKIANGMQQIICGNDYLANYFFQYNKNIQVIPTAVHAQKYLDIPKINTDTFNVLWSGSGSGLIYLEEIEPALFDFFSAHHDAKLIVLSNKAPKFSKLIQGKHFEFRPWSEQLELTTFRESAVGLMPMPDNDWTRGKCSYKMICYMAAEMPVVVSPFGMNAQVLSQGNVGIGCKSMSDWTNALESLYMSNSVCQQYGENAIQVVKTYYDIQIISAKLANALKSI
jgi:glycosyltransferase involved in cell wall biosynthesis